jgi:hypothetical protein
MNRRKLRLSFMAWRTSLAKRQRVENTDLPKSYLLCVGCMTWKARGDFRLNITQAICRECEAKSRSANAKLGRTERLQDPSSPLSVRANGS